MRLTVGPGLILAFHARGVLQLANLSIGRRNLIPELQVIRRQPNLSEVHMRLTIGPILGAACVKIPVRLAREISALELQYHLESSQLTQILVLVTGDGISPRRVEVVEDNIRMCDVDIGLWLVSM